MADTGDPRDGGHGRAPVPPDFASREPVQGLGVIARPTRGVAGGAWKHDGASRAT